MNKPNFHSIIKELKGKICWSIVGPSIGSIFSLDFGGKILRNRISNNPNLTLLQKEYDGEYSIMVYCDWRLDDKHKVICGSLDSTENMEKGLLLLQDKIVKDIQIFEPAKDLGIDFDNNLILKLFSNNNDYQELSKNYHFFYQGGCITIGCKGEIIFEE